MDTTKMLKKGILSAEDIRHGLVPEPIPLKVGDSLYRAIKGAAYLPLLLRFAGAGLKARRMMAAYDGYPEVFEPDLLRRWSEGLPDVSGLRPQNTG